MIKRFGNVKQTFLPPGAEARDSLALSLLYILLSYMQEKLPVFLC